MTNTPHKHAEVIKAWADGKEIQSRTKNDENWKDSTFNDDIVVLVSNMYEREWRVKPEVKTGWIAISRTGITSGRVCASPGEAEASLKQKTAQYVDIVACIKIEYTEGEGM